VRAICRGATRAVGVALIGLVLVAGCTHSSSPAASKPPPRFSPADTTRLNRSLASGTESTVRSAIAMPAGQRLSASAARELAAVVPITFNQSSFHLLDNRDATIAGQAAHPPAGAPAKWTFMLFYTGTAWVIADAEPVR
jgi:hypothetical protein